MICLLEGKRSLAETSTTYNDYRRQMRSRFIAYRRAHFPLEHELFDPRREYVFKPEYDFCNLFTMSLDKLLPRRRRHRWFRSMASSQALAVSVLGTMLKRGDLLLLAELPDETGQPLLPGFTLAGEPVFDYRVTTLNERTRTSVDLFLPGQNGHVAIECKLMEREIGACSRVPRFCNGEHVPGECWLTQRGVAYWKHIPKLFQWDAHRPQRPCPIRRPYQLVRTLLAAAIDEQGRVYGHPTALLVYDANHPFFADGREAEVFRKIQTAIRPPVALKRISWQAIARALEAQGRYRDLLDYLEEKYGIVA